MASLARGRFLKYHDSDDVMYRHCLSTMVDPLDAEPRAGSRCRGPAAGPADRCPMLLTPRLAYEREFLGAGLFQLGPGVALFRTDAFSALGGFPEAGVPRDYLFWMQACTKVNVLLVPGNLFYYRVHAGQEVSSPSNERHYAEAMGSAWAMLHSPACPLRGAALEQARRNFVLHNRPRRIPAIQASPIRLRGRDTQGFPSHDRRLDPLPEAAEAKRRRRHTAAPRSASVKTTLDRLAIDGGRPVRAKRLPLHKPWFDHREESADPARCQQAQGSALHRHPRRRRARRGADGEMGKAGSRVAGLDSGPNVLSIVDRELGHMR